MQNLKTGHTELSDIPCQKAKAGHLLIRTHASLISAGTERMLTEFGKANLVEKARQQPDKVHQVLNKIKTDGLISTVNAVRSKLDVSLAMGYCNVGTVIEVGPDISDFVVGDRVVSNGSHAEVVCVPKNLCAKIPYGIKDDEAVFAVIGAIALQGIRLAQPTLGEIFVVTGLGLIGLMTVQLLQANGCRVLGIDFDEHKLKLARQFGAEVVNLSKEKDPVATALRLSYGQGVDGVLITASTHTSEPVHQAALMCRKRGRIVLVGVTGLDLSRDDFYKKELSFQVSCSYGPGRYDSSYEEKGHDYPLGYVRWTEQRNIEAVLEMISSKRIDVKPLVSHQFSLEQAQEAYQLLSDDHFVLGILLRYADEGSKSTDQLLKKKIFLEDGLQSGNLKLPIIGFVGAGNYAVRVLIPAFKKTGVKLKMIASAGGMSSFYAARKFGFNEATTDTENLLNDSQINTAVIVTRHDTHSKLIIQSLRSGKHVFVEKPLAIHRQELEEIQAVYTSLQPHPLLMVGFNRRFAPQVQKIKSLIENLKEPKVLIMTVNAGPIESDHWVQDRQIGGGRIIGEGCHFIDLLRFLVDSPIVSVQMTALGRLRESDKISFSLRFEDGSIGTVHYLANGHKSFPKERLEIFCSGRILQLDNFRKLRGYGWFGFKKMNLWCQDKGNDACVQSFVNSIIQGKPSPIPFEQLIEVARASFDVAEALQD